MEYTTLWQPLLLIFVSFLIGAFFGALAMFWIMRTDNELLRIDVDMNEEKLQKCEDQLDQYLDKYIDDDYEAY
jgi:membrane protein DedA with SNARE-associated domain